MIDVRETGALGDGETKDTQAIQTAIDACQENGGGTVHFPAGRYLSGTITMGSNVILHLDGGAKLLASRDPSDYPESRALLWAEDEENLSIMGTGTIDGQTTADLGRRPGHAGEEKPSFRTRMALFENCEKLRVRDVTMQNSDSWTLHLRHCQDAVVDGVTVLNNYFRTNTDGINPDTCQNVRISNCHIVAGDDCICLKSRDGGSCEDIVVTNCTTESIATAIKLGTESSGDFRDILVNNCTIRNSTVGLGIFVKDGGTVERVTFSNISIRTLDDPALVNAPRLGEAIYPIFFDLERRTDESPVGEIRDVSVSNIHIRSENGVLIQGMEESPILGLSMENVNFRVNRGFDFSRRRKHAGGRANPDDDRITVFARKPSYVTLANAERFAISDIRVMIDEKALEDYGRSALYMHGCVEGSVRDVVRWPRGDEGQETMPAVSFDNCKGVSVGRKFQKKP